MDCPLWSVEEEQEPQDDDELLRLSVGAARPLEAPANAEAGLVGSRMATGSSPSTGKVDLLVDALLLRSLACLWTQKLRSLCKA
mmetsp:Transcript_4479/g.11984  ORF Transcript_4479/g.11984 Transcript_4479/m.11984 type:complete len:84 (+) Transcript_4479:223-474(+)